MREGRESIKGPFSRSVFEYEVAAFDVSKIPQREAKRKLQPR